MSNTHTTTAFTPAFGTLTLAIPAHWLCAVAYGDTTGLDDREAAAFSRWYYDTTRDLGHPIIADCDEEAHFARWHDAAEYGVAACMCHNVTFVYRECEVAA